MRAVKPWTQLGEAKTPDGRKLTFHEQDGHYSIRLNGGELMSTRRHHSEEKLAELACAGLGNGSKVLIGGLGFGFTLRAALAILPKPSRVTVAELFPSVVEWNRNPRLAGSALEDPRLSLYVGDVADCLGSAYDAVLLDVDNGPDAFTVDANASLYGSSGLDKLKAAVKPGGKLAVWSAFECAPFEKALTRAGFRVTTESVRAHAGGGSRHTIFLARR